MTAAWVIAQLQLRCVSGGCFLMLSGWNTPTISTEIEMLLLFDHINTPITFSSLWIKVKLLEKLKHEMSNFPWCCVRQP